MACSMSMSKIIPKSEFTMGNNNYAEESPIHIVNLKEYEIDKTPVSNKAFSYFLDADGYNNREYWTEDGWKFIKENKIFQPAYWLDENWNEPDKPVTGVSWYEAKAYAKFRGKRLPTEAEWEFAAKGPDNNLYPWGSNEPTDEYANFAPGCVPIRIKRIPTGVYNFPNGRSHFGLWDMAGNFFEWCEDNFSPDFSWVNENYNHPHITCESDLHVARGGSGLHDEDYLRCSARDFYPPTVRDNILTIRCVKDGE